MCENCHNWLSAHGTRTTMTGYTRPCARSPLAQISHMVPNQKGIAMPSRALHARACFTGALLTASSSANHCPLTGAPDPPRLMKISWRRTL